MLSVYAVANNQIPKAGIELQTIGFAIINSLLWIIQADSYTGPSFQLQRNMIL